VKALRWLGAAVALLVLMIVLVWAIGSRLPVEHRASVSRTFAADVDTVWSRIDRVEAWPTWRDLTVEVLSPDSVRVDEQGETLVYRLYRPGPHTLVTEIVTRGIPFGGRWTWSVDPGPEGSAVVTIVEEGEVYDPFFRFFSRFIFGHDSTIRGTLVALEGSLDRP